MQIGDLHCWKFGKTEQNKPGSLSKKRINGAEYICLCCPCDKMTAWKKVNLCSSHLLLQILIWSLSLSCCLQLIALDGRSSSSFRLRSAWLERDGWSSVGAREAAGPPSEGHGERSTHRCAPRALPGQGTSANMLQRVSRMRVWWSRRGKKQMLLFSCCFL